MPDGVLDTSGTPLAGHDAIRSWGRARVASTVQTRHISSGMRFSAGGWVRLRFRRSRPVAA